VHHVSVIVGTLRVKLIFDMDTRHPAANEFAHGAHAVKGLAKTCAAVHHHGNIDLAGDVPAQRNLLGHGQQGLGHRHGAARHVAANVGRLEAKRLHQPPRQRVIDGRHVKECLAADQFSQLCGSSFLHGGGT
jgi:hypothetical protein